MVFEQTIMMTQGEILERVLGRLPHPGQIIHVDLSDETAVVFSWRGKRIWVGDNLQVYEVDRSARIGTDLAIVLRALLQRE
jgi:hypothetical protein